MSGETFYLIGIDGGASKTRGVLFNNHGDTLASSLILKGSNLTLNAELSSDLILKLIKDLSLDSNIPLEKIDSIGLGLAGSSNKDGRDQVFGKLDNLNLSQRTLIMSDAEAAYELNCPGDFGILVNVGTGVICFSRQDSEIFREAGKGYDKGDIGGGYWIGRQAILNLSLNETTVEGDPFLEEIMDQFIGYYGGNNFQDILVEIYNRSDAIKIIAGFTEYIIKLAENGNEIALSIVQEATHGVSNYILSIIDKLNYIQPNLVLAGNGSIIKNDFYRKQLNDELRFQFSNIHWTFSSISCAYGSAILAARVYGIDIKISDIINGESVVCA